MQASPGLTPCGWVRGELNVLSEIVRRFRTWLMLATCGPGSERVSEAQADLANGTVAIPAPGAQDRPVALDGATRLAWA